MKPLLPLLRRFWVPAFLAVCALYVWLNAGEILHANTVPQLVRPKVLLLALAAQAGVWYLLALGWQHVVRERSQRQFSLREAFVHLAFFSVGKYLPGKIWGMAARSAEMARSGVATSESVEATIHEQFLVLHSALVITALFLPVVVNGWLPWLIALIAVASAASAGQLVHLLLPKLARLLGRETRFTNLLSVAASARMIGFYAAAWLFHGAILAVLYASISGDLESLSIHNVGLLMLGNTVGMLAGFAAVFAPAGLGAREAAMAAVLSTGMPVNEAIALSVAMRLWTVAMDLFLGLAFFARHKIA